MTYALFPFSLPDEEAESPGRGVAAAGSCDECLASPPREASSVSQPGASGDL